MYKGYRIEPNNTGYVNFDFYKPDDELISGNGKDIEDCKNQIDELVNLKIRNRLHEKGYHRTKVKEFLKPKKSKRKYITINGKRETRTITGVPINKNGKPIFDCQSRWK